MSRPYVIWHLGLLPVRKRGLLRMLHLLVLYEPKIIDASQTILNRVVLSGHVPIFWAAHKNDERLAVARVEVVVVLLENYRCLI